MTSGVKICKVSVEYSGDIWSTWPVCQSGVNNARGKMYGPFSVLANQYAEPAGQDIPHRLTMPSRPENVSPKPYFTLNIHPVLFSNEFLRPDKSLILPVEPGSPGCTLCRAPAPTHNPFGYATVQNSTPWMPDISIGFLYIFIWKATFFVRCPKIRRADSPVRPRLRWGILSCWIEMVKECTNEEKR